jgi:Amt family ammonium transporter
VVSVGAFAFATSWLAWMALEKTVGVRVSDRIEQLGQDVAELGIEAYPEFVLMPEPDDES